MADLAPHGTRARYLHRSHPCRCAACTEANTLYHRERRGCAPRSPRKVKVSRVRPDIATHCPAGHPWNEETIRWVRNRRGELTWKLCRVCERERRRGPVV